MLMYKMIIADDSGPRPAPKSWSRMPTGCYLQTARYLQSCSFCTREDEVVLANLPARGLQNCCTTTIPYNCITDYNSKIHMSKIYNEQK